MRSITPVHPDDAEAALAGEPVTDETGRTTLGMKFPSRRTLIRLRMPSRRTLARLRMPSRRTLAARRGG
jgi:hypothetical protein